MDGPDVLLIGVGGVGSYALEFLARSGAITHVVAADYNDEWGRRKVHTIRCGAALQGYYPRLEFAALDLRDIAGTASLIQRLQPRLIFNCATAQTWWVRHQYLLPEQASRLGEAGAGPWLPTHMALAAKLMAAIQDSGWQGHVINSGFADASNAVLARQGMAPTMGLGNIDLLIPSIQIEAAKRLKVPVSNVQVFGVLHHYHLGWFAAASGGAPRYFLRIMVGDQDVTGEFDTDLFLHETRQKGVGGQQGDALVAASGAKNALALLRDTGLLTHTNGPQGLPGGYPVRVGAAGAEVFVPQGMTLEEAIGINENAQRGDGIERIEDDGTVVYTDRAVEIMKEVLDYDLKPLKFEQLDERSEELVARFRALANR